MTDLLESVNLTQHVEIPTHRRGHTLDLTITRKEEDIMANVRVLADICSDYRVIYCKINHSKPPLGKILRTRLDVFGSTKNKVASFSIGF